MNNRNFEKDLVIFLQIIWKISESFSKQTTQLIIAAHNCHSTYLQTSQWKPSVYSLQSIHSPVVELQVKAWLLHSQGSQLGKFQYPGLHSSHLRPYELGLQVHCPFCMSQKASCAPVLWQLQARNKNFLSCFVLFFKSCDSCKLMSDPIEIEPNQTISV